ncbi:conserved hypothetical protein [Talaromyces stipitatus ATCC 10500]|uniref:Bromo domain-containing protein n=1 Tax=Talaromyces stipitatus (strain ATCC 10500 / CBS 375.48 / QM 6759 / NRRL 1006) TaxID=441959 RepID=B8ML60_TALSN|nr:uncharacterized protein TSTA_049150 [Talaromyces stipitatus ATCC 10500]EED15476.1 conserved hypothetical protein [Talaromyces stipitatus ATCC 10500]
MQIDPRHLPYTRILAPINTASLVSGYSDLQWGMPPLSAYTPFESLLFFQCLASLNSRPTNFAAISDTLRKNQFIKEDDAFDTNRLSPQALEDLYTTLLQEGIQDTSDKNGQAQDGGNPKKRKIVSGTAATQSQIAIIPELVSQLYARYKDRVTKEIRDEEKRYRDISQEIERLQKDALRELAVPAPPEQKALAGPTEAVAEQASDKMDLDVKQDAKLVETSALSVPRVPSQGVVDAQAHPAVPPEQQATPIPPPAATPIPKPDLAPPIPDTSKQQASLPAALAPKEGTPQQLPPQSPQISQPHPQQLPPEQAIPGGQIPVASTPPVKPAVNGKPPTPLAPHPPVIPQLSSNIQVKVPPPPQPQRLPPQAAPRGAAANRNQPNLPPGSTLAFQAQQGTSLPATPTSQRQVQPVPAFGRGTPVPVGSPAFSQLPQGQQQFQQWAPHPQAGVFPATPHAPQYNNQPLMPKQGTFFPHTDTTGRQVPFAPQHQGPATPGQYPHPVQTPIQMEPQTTPLATPSFSDPKQPRPHRPSMDTAGSLTPWKRTPNLHINIPDTPGSPPRPKPEDISPISERAPSPIELELPAKEAPPQKKRGRGRKQSVPSDTETATARAENLAAVVETKRAGSIASTWSRARSVASRDEESATELATAQRKVKHEAPPTPAGVSEDVDVETRAGPRRRAVVSAAEEAQAKTRTKRKRGASETLEIDTIQPMPSRSVSSQLVYCTRNFTRTGAPIMNDVAAHKHASIFAKPLTEREAPGYKDLIYRPQDLKSIRSALSQGNRAVAAATEAAAAEGESPLPTSGTPSKNTAWLPKTPDLIPPKAIVNSSQLEKELIRMFANAIMFNPAPEAERGFGPSFRMVKPGESTATTRSASHPWDLDEGGIIRDTREMCDDVEKAVTKWRAAERTTTTDETSNKSMLSLRGSSGDSNADGTDDHK